MLRFSSIVFKRFSEMTTLAVFLLLSVLAGMMVEAYPNVPPEYDGGSYIP
jgi:hypothetical protein